MSALSRASANNRPIRRIFGWAAASTLVAALIAGVVVAPPAAAVLPDAEELLEMLDETPWANGGVPDTVWRGDTRSPAEIARDGFTPRGDNDNLADHVLDKVRPKDSAYVSTGGDPESVEQFMRMGTVDENGDAIPRGDFWVYEIAPDENFVNVQKSFKDALFPDGTADSFNVELAENLDSGNPDEWITKIVDENEWAARGGVRPNSVRSSTKYTHYIDDFGDHAWRPEAPERAPNFSDPESAPRDEARPIPTSGACYPSPEGRADACLPVIDDEDSLSELHKGRFDGDLEGVDFTTDLDRAVEDPETFLIPAPETLDELAAGGDFGHLSGEVADAFEKDLDRIRSVSSDPDLLASVGEDLEYGFEDASEFLPYFGIAATGYALREDWEDGKWGDLVFDGIAEVVQVAMEADPAFLPFMEPVLLADLFLKEVADWLWKLAHPAAEAADWRKHLDNANDQLDDAPTVLLEHWAKERGTALDNVFREQVDEAMGESLAKRMRSDAAVLKSMRTAIVEELRLRAALSAARAEPDARVGILGAGYDAEVQVAAATQRALTERYAQYQKAFPSMVDIGTETVWNLDLTKMADEFLAEPKIAEYIDSVTKQPWEAYYGASWDSFDTRKLKPLVDSSIANTNQLIRDVERSRTWTETDPFDTQEYVGLFGAAFEEKVGEVTIVRGPEPKVTQIGVHRVSVGTADGAPLAPGKTATLSWNRADVDDASIEWPAGGTVSWTVDLPSGIDPVGLPKDEDEQLFSTRWSASGNRVTGTVTAKQDNVPLVGPRQYDITVTGNSRFRATDVGTILFTSDPSTRSLAPRSSFGLTEGGLRPADNDPVTLVPGGHADARVVLTVHDRTVTRLGDGVVELRAPEGTRFVTQTRVDGHFRPQPTADWERSEELTSRSEVVDGGVVLRIWPDAHLTAKKGSAVSWTPRLEANVSAQPGDRAITYTTDARTNLGAVVIAGEVPVIVNPAYHASPITFDTQVVPESGEAAVRFGYDALEALPLLSDAKLRVSTHTAGVLWAESQTVKAQHRSSSDDEWGFWPTPGKPSLSEGGRTMTVTRDIGHPLDQGAGLSYTGLLRTRDWADPGPVTITWELSGTLGGRPVSTTGAVDIVVGEQFRITSGSVPELVWGGESKPFPVRATVLGAPLRSVTSGTVTITAPTGLSFAPTDRLVAMQSTGAGAPTEGPAVSLEDVVLHDGGRRLTGSLVGGPVNLPAGGWVEWRPMLGIGSWTAPEGRHGVGIRLQLSGSAGDASGSGSGAVVVPEAPRAEISQTKVPALLANQAGTAEFGVRTTGATPGRGLAVSLQAPTGATFASATVRIGGASASREVTGHLSTDRRRLSFGLFDAVVTSARTTIATSIVTGPSGGASNRSGVFAVEGGWTAAPGTTIGWGFDHVEPPRAEVDVKQTVKPVIPEQESRSASFTFTNTGTTAPSGSSFELRAPTNTVFPSSGISIVGPDGTEALDGTVSADRRTLTVDAPSFRVPVGQSVTLSVQVRNLKAGWSPQLVDDGFLKVTSGAAVPVGSTVMSVLSHPGKDKWSIWAQNSSGMIGEARIRTSKTGGRLSATVEEYRMQVPSEYSQRSKANVDLTVRYPGVALQTWRSTDSLRQDGAWRALGGTAEIRKSGSVPRMEALVDFTFDMPGADPHAETTFWF
ncbi:MAG: hypothetical protein V4737_08500 [Curtobacterium sp.]